MSLHLAIESFSRLGQQLKKVLDGTVSSESEIKLSDLIKSVNIYNGWFTEGNVRLMLGEISSSLQKENLQKWLSPYQNQLSFLRKQESPSQEAEIPAFTGMTNKGQIAESFPKRIGVIAAGNIPLVGFHDFLSVLLTGNVFVGKLSSDDNLLLPAIAQLLIDIEPSFKEKIIFQSGFLKNIDAVIATGSNNSARYFEYYFGKYPHIIRKNRNSVAVLTGTETPEQLRLLSDDIFSYFGLGCRNVSKIYVPEKYDLPVLLKEFERYGDIINHKKYGNNYDYMKAIYLVNRVKHLDTGFALFKEDVALASPVSVVFYEFYSDLNAVKKALTDSKGQIQCIVAGNSLAIDNSVDFGMSQKPQLWDYADGVDTLDFLLKLN